MSDENAETPPPLWQYISPDSYEVPSPPVKVAAQEGLNFLRKLLPWNISSDTEKEVLVKSREELRTLPDWQRNRIAPQPDWAAAAEQLSVALEEWLSQEKLEKPVLILVAPPHSHIAHILTHWAEKEEWQLFQPPSPTQILAGDDSLLEELDAQDGSWVLPHLEKTYLRHTKGLNLVRQLLDQAYAGQFGRGIIACDSWAWTFLQHIWHSHQPATLTLQPFPEADLGRLFQTGEKFLFRQADNGAYLLPPPTKENDSKTPEETEEEEAEEIETSDFLPLLAAHSRGVLGIAWEIWRHSLRAEPDDILNEETTTQDKDLPQQTVWVAAWNQLDLPEVPSNSGHYEAMVLHTLLLHNGLPHDKRLLPRLLPLSTHHAVETILRLEDAGLVAKGEEEWRVGVLGYTAVRAFIQNKGYMVDQF